MSRINPHNHAAQQPTALSQTQLRGLVDRPADGVGFAHGRADVDVKQVGSWIARQPPDVIRALKDPNADVVIVGRTSGTGGKAINKELAHQRSQNLADVLVRQFGVRARVVPRGEPGPLTGRDHPADRVAKIRVDAARSDRLSEQRAPNRLQQIISGFDTARAQSLAETREAQDARSSAADLVASIIAEALNELTGGLTGGAKLFFDGTMALGKAKAQADAKVVRQQIGKGFASVFEAVGADGAGNVNAAVRQASRRAPKVHSESYYKRFGLNNTERWHQRDERGLAAFDRGVTVAEKLLSSLTPAQRKLLAQHLSSESYGSSYYDKVRNFVDSATGASGARVKLDAKPMQKLQSILDAAMLAKD